MAVFDEQYSSGQVVFDAQSDPPPPSGAQPILRVEKVIANLPATLIANTIYTVRTGVGFDIYISDTTGAIAHQLNLPNELTTKSVTLDAPTALERVILFRQKEALTLSEVNVLLPAGSSAPSVTFNLGFGPDVSLAGTELWASDVVVTNTTTGLDLTAIDNPTIPANSWVWLAIKAVSGVVPNLHLTMKE